MTDYPPTPVTLWNRSGHNGRIYRRLLREHGYLPPLADGTAAPAGHGWERPEHRRARERTDEEQAAVEAWARSETERHRAHGCSPDATGCVEGGPAVPDDPAVLRQDLLALMRQRGLRAKARADGRTRVNDSP